MFEADDPCTRWLAGPHRETGTDWAYLLGHAVDTERASQGAPAEDTAALGKATTIVALEFVGPATTVDRLRRDLRRGEWVTIDRVRDRHSWQMYRERVRCDPAPSTYRALLKPLPGGWTHVLILHPRATLPEIHMGESFYVVDPARIADFAATEVPFERTPDHFIHALDLAIPLPIVSAWARYLWNAGREADLITELPADGLSAWRVLADEDSWAKAIRKGVRSGALIVEGRS